LLCFFSYFKERESESRRRDEEWAKGCVVFWCYYVKVCEKKRGVCEKIEELERERRKVKRILKGKFCQKLYWMLQFILPLGVDYEAPIL
jgi:hypothetical protein